MRLIAALAILVMLAPAALAGAAASPNCGAPTVMADGWPVAAPAKEGLDPKLVCAIGPTLAQLTSADPNGVVIVRHGTLVYEHYFIGSDQRWGKPLGEVRHNATTLHDLQSVTKSVVGLLAGIAFDRGWIGNLDAPVLSFFPEYAGLHTPEKDRIPLRDLLTMTSGFNWQDTRAFALRIRSAPDPVRFVLQQPIATTPGTAWRYSGIDVDLLGVILEKAARRPLTLFAKQALFEPLGIAGWEWQRFPDGILNAAGGLRLRPRDLAKIGQLALNRGLWHGRRIVSAAWIKQMTARHSPRGWLFIGSVFGADDADAYGYLWWLGRTLINDHSVDWVGGLRYGGQRLFVVPSLDLVVAVTAGDFRRGEPQGLAGETALSLATRAVIH